MYGKTMSIADELMIRYFELVTPVAMDEISRIRTGLEEGALHPRDVKMRLAGEIVTIYHGEEAAAKAEEEFKNIFQKKELPDEVPDYVLDSNQLEDGLIWLPKLLTLAGLVSGTSEGKRMVKQGAVRINDERVNDPDLRFMPEDGSIIKAGKRKFARVVLK